MDAKQLLQYIIRPVLTDLDLWSGPAERLVLGTACQESACGEYVHQSEGPALGIYQMEPATHDDIWDNYLSFLSNMLPRRAKLWTRQAWEKQGLTIPDSSEMVFNLAYATAMCRIHYLRVPEPIPDYLAGQAEYWKKYYNTELGHGTAQQYINAWNRFVTPSVLTDWT